MKIPRSVLAVFVAAVVVHSLCLGILLIVLTTDLFSLFGWEPLCNPFFLHQVGVFHIVVAAIYAYEFIRIREIYTILIAKTAAVVFLLVEYILFVRGTPLLLAALGDALIGVIALLLCSRRKIGS